MQSLLERVRVLRVLFLITIRLSFARQEAIRLLQSKFRDFVGNPLQPPLPRVMMCRAWKKKTKRRFASRSFCPCRYSCAVFFFPLTMVVGSDFESCICSCKMVCYSRKGDGWKYATCGSVDPEVLLTTTDPAPKRRQTRAASAASKAKPKRQKS